MLLLSTISLIICLHLHLPLVSPQNIDALSPTIVMSGVSTAEESFGWSIAQHLSPGDATPYVLVSAPTGDATMQREGRVYKCPFDNRETCQYQPIFTSREVDDPVSFIPKTLSAVNSSYEGQLMGFSLKSFGSRIVACAPLYYASRSVTSVVIDSVKYFVKSINGRCIVLNSTLGIHLQVSTETTGQDLFLAGLDMELLDENEMALPSSFAGSNPKSGKLDEIMITTYDSPVTTSSVTSNVPYDGLLGYHMDKGYFTTTTELQSVASSPRSNSHFGKLEIFSSGQDPIVVEHTIIGEEADGYFGYDFAVLDLSQEHRYNSIVVGCPLCARERGRIYIYTHTGNPTDPFTMSVFESPSLVQGRFGLAVAQIGDSDLDGLTDIAVSAPYEGRGVVYVFRGSESGLVTADYQTLQAVEDADIFGFSLSGGLDIDSNGYPDFTVGSLSTSIITSFRGSPLVSVTIEIMEQKNVLDVTGTSDLLCPLGAVSHHCFEVAPCFYYETRQGTVSQFALGYVMSVDEEKSRVGTYKQGRAVLGGTRVTGNLTILGPGAGNRMCAETVTFALDENILDVSAIPVSITIDDIPEPLALESNSNLTHFGDPLHPILIRYTRGDVPAPRSLEYQIEMNANCTSGDPEVCEGDIAIEVSEILKSGSTQFSDNGSLALVLSNEFGYSINISNVGTDTAINPTLALTLPPQTLLSRTVPPLSCMAPISPSLTPSGGTQLECIIKNLMSSGEMDNVEVYFVFNDTTPLLTVGSVEVLFSGVDGISGNVTGFVPRTIQLFATAEYRISSRVAETVYRGLRSAVVFPDPSSLSLSQVGPQITLSVVVQVSPTSSTVPRSLLYVYIPVEVVEVGEGEEDVGRPLIIPQRIVLDRDNVNCSQFQTIPEGLSASQKTEADFLPQWVGPPPSDSPECENNGTYRCGVIMCTIFDLRPPPENPHEVTIFSRLYSPTIGEGDKLVEIHKSITSETELPVLGENSIDQFHVLFTLSPGTREIQRDCIRYWVVVVSVVIGIATVIAIITAISVCGLCYQWYKHRKEENEDFDQTDNDYTFRRTIPPIPGLNNGGTSSTSPPPVHPPMVQQWTNGGAMANNKEMEKMEEADYELEKELKEMATGKRVSTTSSLGKVDLPFDPSLGLEEGYEGGVETDL